MNNVTQVLDSTQMRTSHKTKFSLNHLVTSTWLKGLTPEELEETQGFKLLLKCVERIAKNSIVS